MKYARKWNHENIWFVFVLTGLVLFPWLIALATIPSLLNVYLTASKGCLVLIASCGAGWGVGVVLVGVAFRKLGIGLGFAIILGLSALGGSLVPYLAQSRESLSGSQGHLYLLGGVAMIAGIALVSLAGTMRQRTERADGAPASTSQSFAVGLTIAIVAGILSSLLSDGIAFTSSVVDAAKAAGASPVWAPTVVLAPLTTFGSLANLFYCGFMMRRNRSAGLFFQPSILKHWLFGLMMGVSWYGGLAIYGLGEQSVGSVIGWPLFIGAMILSSSAAGFVTGEWRTAGKRATLVLCGGSLTIFAALVVVGIAHGR
jgi:L-rhamnose-H+ transport protein